MKDNNEDRALRELFRKKLEGAELIPSPGVGRSLMRKLTLRQFLRFKLTRFNIWYAGAIAVTGTLLAVFLSSFPADNEQNESSFTGQEQVSFEKQNDDTMVDIATADEQRKISETPGTGKQEDPLSQERNITGKDRDTDSEIRNKTVSTAVVPDISEEGLNVITESEHNKLQGKAYRFDNFIAASVTEGCAPLRVMFRSMIAPDDSCRWTFGDGGSSTERNPEWIFDIDGEYRVSLDVLKADGRKEYSVVDIIVHPKPVARFEITPEKAEIPGDEIIFMNYSSDAVRYKWNFGDGTNSTIFEPAHTYSKYDNYNVQLIAFSEFGCSDTLTIYNAFEGSAYFVRFPNAFIPNPDGPSEGWYSPRSDESAAVFHPVSSGVAEYQLRIFSRLGMLIFESNDINIGWDGYYKGALTEPGVYIWKVRGKYINGEPFTKMGDVTLLRY